MSRPENWACVIQVQSPRQCNWEPGLMAQNTQASCVKRILAREWLWLLGTYIASIACVVYVNLDQMRTSEFDGDVFVVFSVAVSTMPFLYIPIGVVRLTVWAVKAARSRPKAPRKVLLQGLGSRARIRWVDLVTRPIRTPCGSAASARPRRPSPSIAPVPCGAHA